MYLIRPATAATVGEVFEMLPDVLDIGIILKHRPCLAVYSSVRLDGLDAVAQDYALHSFLLIFGPDTNHVEIYVSMVVEVT